MDGDKTLIENATDKLHSVVDTAVIETRKLPRLSVVLFNEIMRTRVLTIGAAVAFYLLLSLVPLLMVVSAIVGALHVTKLFPQLLDTMAMLVPPSAMAFVRTVLQSVLSGHTGGILSFGVLSYIYSAAGSFSALIEALNIAYEVKIERPWWRDKLQAILLTFTCGALALFSLLCLLAGPHVIHFLSNIFPISSIFASIWPTVRWIAILLSFIVNIMLLYHLAPNRKVRFSTLWPGAAFAVGLWTLGSLGLSFYISHFGNYNATYGSLGAIIILMLWLYLTSIAILIGAELNAELWKQKNPELYAAVMAREDEQLKRENGSTRPPPSDRR